MIQGTRELLSGTVKAGFEPARWAFEDNFRSRGELGGSFAVFHRGVQVVDLWGGWANVQNRRHWGSDTLGMLFSATKGVVATCFLLAAERGAIELDAPVSDCWPAFCRGGQASVTVRQILNHRSGMAAVEAPLCIEDLGNPDRLASVLVRQLPIWKPGSAQGYHGVTYGLYLGEIFRRAVGQSLGQFLKNEIAGPLSLDVHLGLPREHDVRVATIYPVSKWQQVTEVLPYLMRHRCVERRLLAAVLRPGSYTSRAFAQPAELGPKGFANFNRTDVHRLELPWVNGFASATGLARMYATLAVGGTLNGVALCKSSLIEAVFERQTFSERDLVLHKPIGWSQGFIKEEGHLFSPNPASFGHPGMGGALGYCDPVRELAWAYIPNRLDFRLRSPRALALSRSLYECPAIKESRV